MRNKKGRPQLTVAHESSARMRGRERTGNGDDCRRRVYCWLGHLASILFGVPSLSPEIAELSRLSIFHHHFFFFSLFFSSFWIKRLCWRFFKTLGTRARAIQLTWMHTHIYMFSGILRFLLVEKIYIYIFASRQNFTHKNQPQCY